MAKFDAEDILDMVLDIMTSGGALNTKIAAIEAEKTTNGKGLTPTLAQINSSAYYEQSWDDNILNYSPAIFYGIEDVQTITNGPVSAKTYKLFIEVVLVDNGLTSDGHKRINRYARALEELFEQSFAPAVGFGQVRIDQVRPQAFKLELETSEEIKVGGISVLISLA